MLDSATVEALAVRKRLLVEECEAHRRAFALEVAQLQSDATALAQPVKSALSVSRLLVVVASLAGFLLGRRKGRSGGWFKKGLFGWQLLSRFQPLWAQLRNRPRHSN